MSEKSNADTYGLCICIGCLIGILGTLYIVNPDQLKQTIAGQETEVKTCKTALDKQNNIIEGMLMNK